MRHLRVSVAALVALTVALAVGAQPVPIAPHQGARRRAIATRVARGVQQRLDATDAIGHDGQHYPSLGTGLSIALGARPWTTLMAGEEGASSVAPETRTHLVAAVTPVATPRNDAPAAPVLLTLPPGSPSNQAGLAIVLTAADARSGFLRHDSARGPPTA